MSEDLTFWITIGTPKGDTSNYVRLSRTGLDEGKRFTRRADLEFSESLRECRARWETTVAEHLARFTAADLQDFADLETQAA